MHKLNTIESVKALLVTEHMTGPERDELAEWLLDGGSPLDFEISTFIEARVELERESAYDDGYDEGWASADAESRFSIDDLEAKVEELHGTVADLEGELEELRADCQSRQGQANS